MILLTSNQTGLSDDQANGHQDHQSEQNLDTNGMAQLHNEQ